MAAEAAEAAEAQGKFWEMHDVLLEPPGRLHPSRPAPLRRAPRARRRALLGRGASPASTPPRVAEDVPSADESGVAGTPTFFINGRRHSGAYDIDTLTTAVRRAHQRARIEAEAKAPA